MSNNDREDAAHELANLCAQIRAAHPERTWHVRGTPAKTAPDPRLSIVVRLYRAGLTTAQVSEQIGVVVGSLGRLIAEWRRAGLWPEDVERRVGRPKKGNDG